MSTLSPAQKEYRSIYLRSSHWKDLRERFWKSKLPKKYGGCGRSDIVLHLHHRGYKRKGRERLTDLILVCKKCHFLVHGYKKTHPKTNLWQATSRILKRIRKHPNSHKRIYKSILKGSQVGNL